MENRLDRIERCVEILILMAGINMGLLVVGISIGITILVSGFHARATLVELLRSIKTLMRQCVSLIDQSSGMANASRIYQQFAARAMQKVEEAAPVLSEQVSQVPEKTADAVVDKLKSGDSGVIS